MAKLAKVLTISSQPFVGAVIFWRGIAQAARYLGERRIDILMSAQGADDERHVVRAARRNGIELARA